MKNKYTDETKLELFDIVFREWQLYRRCIHSLFDKIKDRKEFDDAKDFMDMWLRVEKIVLDYFKEKDK